MSLLKSTCLLRQFSSVPRRAYRNNNVKPNKVDLGRSSWDHVYGISSVLSALHSKKRSVLDTLYIQLSDEKKTTQKKDDQLITEIMNLAKTFQIKVVALDKGDLNNLTDNKLHQVNHHNLYGIIDE